MKYVIILLGQYFTDGWVLPVNVNRNVVLPMRPFEKKSMIKYSSKDTGHDPKDPSKGSRKDPSKCSKKDSRKGSIKGSSKSLSKEVSNYNDWLLGSNRTGIDTRLEPDSIILNTTENELCKWLDWFYMNEKVKFLENPYISINEKLEKVSRQYIHPLNIFNGLWNEFADN